MTFLLWMKAERGLRRETDSAGAGLVGHMVPAEFSIVSKAVNGGRSLGTSLGLELDAPMLR